MSYINNKFKVNAQLRETASNIYHSIFLPKVPKPAKRALVENVILDILQCFLRIGEQISQEMFILNLFRIYDYLVILDIGSIEDVLFWLNKMY